MPIPSTTGSCENFPHRISISELAPQIQQMTGLSLDYITKNLTYSNREPGDYSEDSLFKLGVNCQNDKTTADEKKAGFDPKTSISREEAYRFIDRLRHFLPAKDRVTIFTEHPKDKMAYALYKIYFGDMPLYEAEEGTPSGIPPHEDKPMMFYKRIVANDDLCTAFSAEGCYAHDGDTANAMEFDSNACYRAAIAAYKGPYRESGGDSPERGSLPFFKNDPKDPKNAQHQETNRKMVEWLTRKVRDPKFQEDPPSFANTKIVDNAIKVLRASTPSPEKISPLELYHLTSLIVKNIDYDGTLAFVQMNDMIDFVEQKSGFVATEDNVMNIGGKLADSSAAFFTRETTIRFTSDDTPEWVCGLKQVADRYLRELMSPGITDRDLIGDYLDTRFVQGFLAFTGKVKLYERYRAEMGEIEDRLSGSNDPEVKRLMNQFGKASIYTPESLFKKNGETMKALFADFFEKHPEYDNDYNNSISIIKILIGVMYPYQKYRSQDFKLFKDAGEFARKNGLGFWSKSRSYSILWDENKKLPRYFPKDCLTGEE